MTVSKHPPAPLLEVVDLSTHFYTEEGELKAVDGVSFQLGRGRTLALVGESGCGKSVTAYSLLRLINPPGKIVGGSVLLHRGPTEEPLDVLELKESSAELYAVRGGRAAFIFQEATAALSPVHTIGNQLVEAIRLHQPRHLRLRRKEALVVAADMLERVGIQEPQLCLQQYAHELSGGMRQRAVIAMALVTDPELLIADEPTTALDVTIQAQILALLKKLQAELKMAILLITHDLGVVSQMADEVLVMYLGRVVERGPVRSILKKPRHPYSMGLLASLPSLTPVGRRLPSIRGSVPALSDIPKGCPFHPRCPHAEPGRCNVGPPPRLEAVGPRAPEVAEHAVACHRTREIALERLLERPNVAYPESGRASVAPPAPQRPSVPPQPTVASATVASATVASATVASATVASATVASAAVAPVEPWSPDMTPMDVRVAEAAWFEAGLNLSLPPEDEPSE